MPSIRLGYGTDAIEITGDILRVDNLANQLGTAEEVAKYYDDSYYDGPEDDIRICELPKAVRRIASQLSSYYVLHLSHDVTPYSFVGYSKEVDAWVRYEAVMAGPAAFAVTRRHLAYVGLVPLGTRKNVGEPISEAFPNFGIVIAPTVGLLTPWNSGNG